MSYRTSENKFLDNGNEFQMHGTNFTGMEGIDAVVLGLYASRTIPQFVEHIKMLGFNTIRLPISSRTISNVDVAPGVAGIWEGSINAYLKGKKSLDILDHLIDECEKKGMRYFFDSHNKNPDGHPDGPIPSLWYGNGITEAKWIEDMVVLAKRYKGKAGFIGWDLKNEPNSKAAVWGGNLSNDWRRATAQAFKAIDKVNSDLIVIIEPLSLSPGSGFDVIEKNLPDIPRDRCAYSSHNYFADVWKDFGEGFKDSAFPSNMPAVWKKQFGDFASRFPLVVGEFGGFARPGSKDLEGQVAFVDYLRKNNISAIYWTYQDTSGDTGGILADGGFVKVREDKMAFLSKLRTDRATYTTDLISPPAVPPPVIPPVITTPPSAAIQAKDVVRFITGEGPKMVVQSVTQKDAKVAYMSPYTLSTIPLEMLVKV